MKNLLLLFLLGNISFLGNSQSQLLFDEINLTEAREKYDLTGKGAIIAIFDRGIDYRHEDFINDDGTTKILAIWDLSNQEGANAADNPYGYGTIFRRTQINDALNSGILLNTRDASGHGTVTAGVAAGDGSESQLGTQGVAPDADLIIIKITSEGAPAHSGQEAESPFYAESYLDEAIDFVKAIAMQENKPVSMIANFGSLQGPMDGTSAIARMLDESFDDDDKGVAFICGSSDDGDLKNHLKLEMESNQNYEFSITKSTTFLRMDMWYLDTDEVELELNIDGVLFTIPSINGPSDSQSSSEGLFTYYHQGSNVDFFGAENGKNEILIDFNGSFSKIDVKVIANQIFNGQLNAVLNPSNIFVSGKNEFSTFVTDGSIWDLAAAKNNICPNSYILRNEWESIDGNSYSYPGHENGVGSLWTGSGVGPTVDGRIGIDISVPGNINFGAYAKDSYFAFLTANKVEDGENPYGVIAAVSGANPVLAGVVALMLEANPNLSAKKIKDILQRTARSDAFTGNVPNTNWGYGKLDVLAALDEVILTDAKDENLSMNKFSIVNPAVQNLTIIPKEEVAHPTNFKVLDSHGKKLIVKEFHQGFTI